MLHVIKRVPPFLGLGVEDVLEIKLDAAKLSNYVRESLKHTSFPSSAHVLALLADTLRPDPLKHLLDLASVTSRLTAGFEFSYENRTDPQTKKRNNTFNTQ
jgi:hypothetical protein